MLKPNMKKVVIAVAFLLLLAPATVAQSSVAQIQAKALCREGDLRGIVIVVPQPGKYEILFDENICSPSEAPKVNV